MRRELEAIVWCPECRAEKYRIYRVSENDNGVYRNVTDPEGAAEQKQCDCGCVLERKR